MKKILKIVHKVYKTLLLCGTWNYNTYHCTDSQMKLQSQPKIGYSTSFRKTDMKYFAISSGETISQTTIG